MRRSELQEARRALGPTGEAQPNDMREYVFEVRRIEADPPPPDMVLGDEEDGAID